MSCQTTGGIGVSASTSPPPTVYDPQLNTTRDSSPTVRLRQEIEGPLHINDAASFYLFFSHSQPSVDKLWRGEPLRERLFTWLTHGSRRRNLIVARRPGATLRDVHGQEAESSHTCFLEIVTSCCGRLYLHLTVLDQRNVPDEFNMADRLKVTSSCSLTEPVWLISLASRRLLGESHRYSFMYAVIYCHLRYYFHFILLLQISGWNIVTFHQPFFTVVTFPG